MTDTNTLGNLIRTKRHAAKLSLRQAGDLCGMSKAYLWRTERGGVANPTVSTLLALASGMSIDPAELFKAACNTYRSNTP